MLAEEEAFVCFTLIKVRGEGPYPLCNKSTDNESADSAGPVGERVEGTDRE